MAPEYIPDDPPARTTAERKPAPRPQSLIRQAWTFYWAAVRRTPTDAELAEHQTW